MPGKNIDLSYLFSGKGLTLKIQVAADVPTVIEGDQNRLQQLLVNLTSNAIKFTQIGTVEVCVYCSGATHWYSSRSSVICV